MFEQPRRQLELAMDEHCLWADLDEVDPTQLEEYPPTIAWETSPGRYQALWLTQGDIQGASWPGRENQCLTYHIGADPSGWDTTQLLRIPGWKNHKPEYKEKYGDYPEGKLLWQRGRVYLQDEFNDLPEFENWWVPERPPVTAATLSGRWSENSLTPDVQLPRSLRSFEQRSGTSSPGDLMSSAAFPLRPPRPSPSAVRRVSKLWRRVSKNDLNLPGCSNDCLTYPHHSGWSRAS